MAEETSKDTPKDRHEDPPKKASIDIPQASIVVAIIGLVGSIVATIISTTAKSQSTTTENKQTQLEQRFANLKGIDVQSGICAGSYMESDWSLGQPGQPSENDTGKASPIGDRRWLRHIVFTHPFSAQPTVLVGIISLDSSARSNSTRVALYYSNVTPNGFDLYAHTWNDSEVYAVEAWWLAYQQ